MAAYMSPDLTTPPRASSASLFSLVGVVNHVNIDLLGDVNHYTSHVRVGDQLWAEFDDSRARHVRQETVFDDTGSESAYLLFYQRVS
jgi:ubiquitin C-terminal hydrolase